MTTLNNVLIFLLPILVTILGIFKSGQFNKEITNLNSKFSKELKELESKLTRENERKAKLSENQKAILFVFQNMMTNGVKKKDKTKLDVIENMNVLINSNQLYKNIFNLKAFENPFLALLSEIALSTCSEKVMALRLQIQESNYKVTNDINPNAMAQYSLLYKYLYSDFTGNQIDDLYLLRFSLNDLNSQTLFVESKDKVYKDLKENYNWDNLKN